MNTVEDSRTAMHEAGHFVFAKMMGLGRITLLTINPAVASDRCEATLGRMERRPLPMDVLVQAESKGIPIESVLLDDADTRRDIESYRNNRAGFITQLALCKLAGAAAETELSTGNGKIGSSDYHGAKEFLLLICDGTELNGVMNRLFELARSLCRGPLCQPIQTTAARLLEKRQLHETELDALWNEVTLRQPEAAQ